MTTQKRNGLGISLDSIFRPSGEMPPPESGAAVGEEAGQLGPDQVDQAETEESRPARKRKPRTAAPERAKGRKVYLTDSLYLRARLQALTTGKKLSVVVAEILDRNLPRFDVQKVA